MDENVKLELERLIGLKRVTKFDVKSMETMFMTLMNEKVNICAFCSAQIKAYQKQLINWYNSNVPQIQQVINAEPAIEAPKGCQSCKQRKTSKK